MRRCSFRSLLLTVALLGAAACGGPEQVQSRTVTIDGAQYELVAQFGPELSPDEVQRLLDRAVVAQAEAIAEAVHPLLTIDVVPHDTRDATHFAVVAFAAEADPEEVEEPEEHGDKSETRAHFVRRGDIKGATDPDVDPALPY